MSEHERVRTAVAVGVCAFVLAAGGVLIDTLGPGGVLRVVGSVLIIFGMMGIGQAAAIGLGHLSPRSLRDRKRNAGGD